MNIDGIRPNDALIVRWLAIAGAGGAAASAAMSHFSNAWVWPAMSLIAALLAIAGIAGWWRAFHLRNRQLQQVT